MKRKLVTDYFPLAKKPVECMILDKLNTQSMLQKLLGDSWYEVLETEVRKSYFVQLWEMIAKERDKTNDIYPPEHLVFNAFSKTPFNHVKVVIVGQDPYHQPKQAMGLSFSVPKGIAIPPSLRNIFAEIGISSTHGDLTNWAKQGVFLLNSLLTVVRGSPMSHAKYVNKVSLRVGKNSQIA